MDHRWIVWSHLTFHLWISHFVLGCKCSVHDISSKMMFIETTMLSLSFLHFSKIYSVKWQSLKDTFRPHFVWVRVRVGAWDHYWWTAFSTKCPKWSFALLCTRWLRWRCDEIILMLKKNQTWTRLRSMTPQNSWVLRWMCHLHVCHHFYKWKLLLWFPICFPWEHTASKKGSACTVKGKNWPDLQRTKMKMADLELSPVKVYPFTLKIVN